MKKQNRFTEVCLLDICLPDYFSGYQYPVIAIPVYKGMTNHDVLSEIKSEINSTYDYLTNENNGFTPSELKLFEQYGRSLKKLPKEKILDDSFFPEGDEYEDYDLSFIYLSLCKPVQRYGMTFLNE